MKQLLVIFFLFTLHNSFGCVADFDFEQNFEAPIDTNKSLDQLYNLMELSKYEKETDSVLIYFNEAMRLAHGLSNEHVRNFSLFIADFFKEKKALKQSLFHALKALQIWELRPIPKRDFIKHFFYLGEVADTYFLIGKPDSTLAYYQKALNTAAKAHDNYFLMHSYNNLGVFYSRTKQLDSALLYYNKAIQSHLKVFEVQNDSTMWGVIHGNIADVLTLQGEFLKSKPYFEINLHHSKQLHVDFDYLATIVKFNDVLLRLKEYKKAEELLAESVALNQKLGSNAVMVDLYRCYFELNLAKNNFVMSDVYWKKYRSAQLELNDEVSRELQYTLDALNEQELLLFETERKNQFLAAKQKQNEANTNLIKVLSVLLFVVVLSGFAFLYLRKGANELRKQKELETVQIKLLAVELKNQELHSLQLNQELHATKKDVTNLALDLHQKQDMRTTVLSKLIELKKVESLAECRKGLDNIVNDLNHKLRIDDNKQIFKENIEKVNSAFYDKLVSTFPLLTKSEREYCGLLRLKLSTKEIATTKNISPESAKVLRHRIRKKLGLDANADIYQFIENL